MTLNQEFSELEAKIVSRIKELEDATAELADLRDLAKRLGIDTAAKRNGATATRSTPARSTPPRKRKRSTSANDASRPKRAQAKRAGRGRRQDEVLALISQHPGIKVSELGKRLSVDPTSLYSVVRRLEADKRIRKDGPQLHVVA